MKGAGHWDYELLNRISMYSLVCCLFVVIWGRGGKIFITTIMHNYNKTMGFKFWTNMIRGLIISLSLLEVEVDSL